MPEPRLHRLAGSPADAEEQQAESDETGRGEGEHPEGERPERFRECPVGSDRRLGDGEEAQEGAPQSHDSSSCWVIPDFAILLSLPQRMLRAHPTASGTARVGDH